MLVDHVVGAWVGDEVRKSNVADLVSPVAFGSFTHELDASGQGQVPGVELSGVVSGVIHSPVDGRRLLTTAGSAFLFTAELGEPPHTVQSYARHREQRGELFAHDVTGVRVRDQATCERLGVFRMEHARCFVQESGRTLREDVGRETRLAYEDYVGFALVRVVQGTEHHAAGLVDAAERESQKEVAITLLFWSARVARSVRRTSEILHDHVPGPVDLGPRRVRRGKDVHEVQNFPVAVLGFTEGCEGDDPVPRVDLVDFHEPAPPLFAE